MEQGTIRLIGSLRAVQPIPEDRVADGGEVDSNLVGSSGDQKTSDDTETAVESRHNLHLGSRRPAALVAAEAPPVAAVAGDGPIDLEAVRGRMAFHDGEVGPLDLALGPGPGQGSQGARVAGEEHCAAGDTVETVEHPQEGPLPGAEGECEQHLVIEGWIVGRSVLGRLGEHTRRFCRDQKKPIVKEKVRSRNLGQWRHPELLGGAKNIDHVTERERPGLNPQRVTVSPHEPVRHQPSCGATAELGGFG